MPPPLTPVERQLFLAAHSGDIAGISKICAEEPEVSVNVEDEAEFTPLTIAIIQGSLEAVKTLVTLGADIQKVGKRGLTPLLLALEEDEIEIVSYLLQRGADPTKQCGKRRGNLLHMAAIYDQVQLMEWLVQSYGLPIDTPIEETGQTALHKASAFPRGSECVQWLLQHGANPCQTDHQGKTALHHAVSHVCTKTTTAALDAYADLLTSIAAAAGVRDHFGRTAFHEACHRQNVLAVKTLMRLPQQASKLDVLKNVDHLGRTPLLELSGNAELLQDMINRMQEIYSTREILEVLNHCDPQGWTALHHAVFCGETAVVELLLSNGARADAMIPGSRQSLLHLVGSGFKVQWQECGKKDPQAWHQQYTYVTDWLLRFGEWFVQHEPVKNGWPKLSIPPLPRLAGLDESFELKPNRSSAMSALLFKKAKASVLRKDKKGNLPFFLPAASGNVSEVFEQLRAAAHEGLFHNLAPSPATTTPPVTVRCNTRKRPAVPVTPSPSRPTQRLRVESVHLLHII